MEQCTWHQHRPHTAILSHSELMDDVKTIHGRRSLFPDIFTKCTIAVSFWRRLHLWSLHQSESYLTIAESKNKPPVQAGECRRSAFSNRAGCDEIESQALCVEFQPAAVWFIATVTTTDLLVCIASPHLQHFRRRCWSASALLPDGLADVAVVSFLFSLHAHLRQLWLHHVVNFVFSFCGCLLRPNIMSRLLD